MYFHPKRSSTFSLQLPFYRDLKHLSDQDITNTFSEHEEILSEKRREYSRLHNHFILPIIDSNVFLIVSELVTKQQMTVMHRKIQSQMFANDEQISNVCIFNITLSFFDWFEQLILSFFFFQSEYLIWNVIIAEWALQIFMKHFNFDEKDAMEHLEKQIDAKKNMVEYQYLDEEWTCF